MPPISNEEQFKFLISCIRNSNNGKVDFTQVAAECKIVSKGAAAKRYERLMKAHQIAPVTSTSPSTNNSYTTSHASLSANGASSSTKKSQITRTSPKVGHGHSATNNAKKRKTMSGEDAMAANGIPDDEEVGYGTSAVAEIKMENGIKTEHGNSNVNYLGIGMNTNISTSVSTGGMGAAPSASMISGTGIGMSEQTDSKGWNLADASKLIRFYDTPVFDASLYCDEDAEGEIISDEELAAAIGDGVDRKPILMSTATSISYVAAASGFGYGGTSVSGTPTQDVKREITSEAPVMSFQEAEKGIPCRPMKMSSSPAVKIEGDCDSPVVLE